jgi:hypothetical protein
MEVEMTTQLEQRVTRALADTEDLPTLIAELEADIRQAHETAALERRCSYTPGITLDDARAAMARAVDAEQRAQRHLATLPALRAKLAATAA